MAELEGPDEHITLERAAALSGLPLETLRVGAHRGHLTAERHGRDLQTTRRWLHRYLSHRGVGWQSSGPKRSLPPDYQTPEGEEPIP